MLSFNAMLLCFYVSWEDQRRPSGVCETFSQSILMMPRLCRSSRWRKSSLPATWPGRRLFQKHKSCTDALTIRRNGDSPVCALFHGTPVNRDADARFLAWLHFSIFEDRDVQQELIHRI